ncbi:YaiI/YqxD family protein [Legionella spiritensis]|uniref:UPF0178 protein Lspi_2455 n=1 Tax=Legionella spiritensis TaxID=452 RepID=A0A0W0YY63_LEGSP|nr:YaiI/YqxD family protein [Legionella spiritensis]KTD61825.1 hypothetical protein Lspi_2455 [Legionella spiritensis]SNV31695.1 Uncharacterized BCR, YaiI/YqxD family COG1671 [Legionella spiritensis]VEG92152.1 Uncharacterized BCR, YaiI/YqxD family COG1671 [Legionella spiritensis]
MKIWIDGDACPNKIKDILFKAAIRTRVTVTVVANHFARIPHSPFIKRIVVDSGFDVADTKILNQIEKGDLVITADIPFANEVVMKKAIALSPRGKIYTENNIKQALAVRDFHTSLRDSGVQQSGESKISPLDIRQFANQLDRLLCQQ